MSTFEVGVWMHPIEIWFWITVLQNYFFTQLTKKSFGVGSRSTIHTIKYHLKICSIQQFFDYYKVKLFSHQLHIYIYVLEYLYREDWLSVSLYIYKIVLSFILDIYLRKEIIISFRILNYLRSMAVDQICKLLLSRSSISSIEFNTEIFMRTSRIMACRQ